MRVLILVSPADVFLGFTNKTCGYALAGTPDGATAGPLLRPATNAAVDGDRDGMLWKQWRIHVVGRTSRGEDRVFLETFFPRDRGTPM